MRKRAYAILLSVLFAGTLTASAETDFDIRAGLNIGGIAPIPIPVEIRAINSYNPLLLPVIEAGADTHISDRWSIRLALRFEQKGMNTSSTVKNYYMEIIGDDNSALDGYWTGNVDTEARISLLTLPVTASYKFSDKVGIFLGPYISYMTDCMFKGTVYDGYLREGTPVGDKIIFEDGASSNYDFSGHYNRIQYGLSLSADWHPTRRLILSAGLNWGLNNVFESEFKTIRFNMYPIYGNILLGYRF